MRTIGRIIRDNRIVHAQTRVQHKHAWLQIAVGNDGDDSDVDDNDDDGGGDDNHIVNAVAQTMHVRGEHAYAHRRRLRG